MSQYRIHLWHTSKSSKQVLLLGSIILTGTEAWEEQCFHTGTGEMGDVLCHPHVG